MPEDKKNARFSEILETPQIVDLGPLLKVHNDVFAAGVQTALLNKTPEPIPEEMFYKALE